MDITVNTKYLPNEKATVHKKEYANGYPALVLTDEYGSPLMTASVNLVAYDEYPAEGHVFIKDWSENEGILHSLIEQGVISGPVRIVQAGFTHAHECKVLF